MEERPSRKRNCEQIDLNPFLIWPAKYILTEYVFVCMYGHTSNNMLQLYIAYPVHEHPWIRSIYTL